MGITLKRRREELGYTLEQVKIKLENMKFSLNRSDIQRIENGLRKIPNAILIKNLCKIYGLDPVKLFKEIGYLDKEISEKNDFSQSEILKENEIKKIKIYSSIATGFGYSSMLTN